jgi:hypothetical protein
MKYAEKLKDPRWQKRRLQVFERDGWKCTKCEGVKAPLHVHHLEYTGEPWDAPDDKLVTLCEHCHYLIERVKLDIHDYRANKLIVDNCFILFAISGGCLYLYRKEGEMEDLLNMQPEVFARFKDFINNVNP